MREKEIKQLSVYERTKLATNTKDTSILSFLSNDLIINIRAAVAKNVNTPKEVINKLSFDPTLNVSLLATKNINYRLGRRFHMSIENICINCNLNELDKLSKCSNCKRNQNEKN